MLNFIKLAIVSDTYLQTLRTIDKAADLTLSELATDICSAYFLPGEVVLLIDDDDSRLYHQCTNHDLADNDQKMAVVNAMRWYGQKGVFQSFISILESEPSNNNVVKKIKGRQILNSHIAIHVDVWPCSLHADVHKANGGMLIGEYMYMYYACCTASWHVCRVKGAESCPRMYFWLVARGLYLRKYC